MYKVHFLDLPTCIRILSSPFGEVPTYAVWLSGVSPHGWVERRGESLRNNFLVYVGGINTICT